MSDSDNIVEGEVVREEYIPDNAGGDEPAILIINGKKRVEKEIDPKSPFVQTIVEESQQAKFDTVSVKYYEPGSMVPTTIDLEDAPLTFSPGKVYTIDPYDEPGARS